MFLKFFFFLLMENLGAMAYSRYTGFREITDRDVLELHCSNFGENPLLFTQVIVRKRKYGCVSGR